MKASVSMLKKLIQINTVCNTSTGKLMGDIQRTANASGYETLSIVGRRKVFQDIRCEKIGNGVSFWIHVIINTLFDRQGYGSYFTTKKIVQRLREENPDIVHLHNLHGYYINLPILFNYLSKEFEGKIFWTFHDCWPITGHCAYFTAAECEKWQSGCSKCQNKKVYPVSLFMDSSKKNYREKRKMFCSLKNLTIITPSEWMKDIVKKSFLNCFPIEVINNGIDLKAFSYQENQKKVFYKYGIEKEKKVLLGVASVWDARKGMRDFIALAQIIPEEYQILLVGLSKKQLSALPSNIMGIQRTDNIQEMAMIYSLSHIFINPSLEESFSLVTAEAIACGTPVIVLNTSAVKELVCDNNGIVIANHDAADYWDAIKKLEEKRLSRKTIMQTAQKYDAEIFAEKVIQLYEQM